MKKLVEDVSIGDRIIVTEEVFNLLYHITSPDIKLKVSDDLINEDILVIAEFGVSGEGRGFLVRRDRTDYHFSKSCGTYLEIK